MSDQREGGIAWTDETWNPMRGCTRVSEGCRHCYAEVVAARFSNTPAYQGLAKRSPPRWTGEVRFVAEKLEDPLRWQRPRRVFVNSMSDVFHEKFSNEQIAAVFGVMAAAQRHTFQVLTKRPKRMLEWFEWVDQFELSPTEPPATVMCEIEARNFGADASVAGTTTWPLPNVWLGVSCEDQKTADERIPLLLQIPAAMHFISAEPLLDTLELQYQRGWLEPFQDLDPFLRKTPRLDWVIVGGESGNHARACDIHWIEDIVKQCRDANVACFVKQLGARPAASNNGDIDSLLDYAHPKGGDPSEWPEELRTQQFPEVRHVR